MIPMDDPMLPWGPGAGEMVPVPAPQDVGDPVVIGGPLPLEVMPVLKEP